MIVKRYMLHLLLALNVVLALGLVAMWVRRDGTLRNTHWVAPAPRVTDFAGMLPALPGVAHADISQFVAMLDRPLFTPTRRPPPPPPPPKPEAPVDNLSTAMISGLYSGNGIGGVIINIAGKHRRVQLNQSVEGWTLKSIQGRSVTFARGDENRVLQLPKAALTVYTGLPPGGGAGPSAAVPRVPTPAAPSPMSGGPQGGEAKIPAPAPRAVFGGRG